MNSVAWAPINFAPARVEVEKLEDGAFIIRSPDSLKPYSRCLGDLLVHWAERIPDRTFLAQRAGEGWRKVSWGQALKMVEAIAQSLLDRGLNKNRPVMILSDNSIDHALLALAAMHVGIPVAPISPAYSLISQDHSKLRYIADLLKPGLVYAADGAKFADALVIPELARVEVVTSVNPIACGVTFDALLGATPGPDVENAFASVRPATVAKILFTSGSTDMPKGVINTQKMLCSNQQAIRQAWPFLLESHPVLVDWLPWNHTFGGNHNFNMVLRHGGTLYIDEGKPMPGLVEKTAANLKEISPTLYFNVPRGFDMLIPLLEKDEELRANFFKDLKIIFYAGAALPQNLWDKMEQLSIRTLGHKVRMVSSWGATETSPMITTVHFDIPRAGIIGLPAPGCEVKMIPNGGKLEMRIKGPNVTPGYFKRDDLTRKAFDEDGWYVIGDAGKLADPDDPSKGIVFDGRVAEDFKLMSGTWVHVGALRLAVIDAAAPVLQDAVVTGHDREEVGLLGFASLPGCLRLCPDAAPDTPLKDLIKRPEVREKMRAAMIALAAEGKGSSHRIARAILMDAPPSIDANEITDKGYINQRAVLTSRAHLVEKLYTPGDDPDVIRMG
ncbi:putative Acyl-CoA synthetase (AMP-forming)/AMP-acid ligase II [Magnetospirillum sp. XM-1]|uniref:feruloyl-CoA synthase n=1 Tax=Magnetospirillum sp. XM-1 TaxID=1663591 RepID=UPI00073DE4A1|nr:feruloyl-CoA synthase [Magnetospirillum sp. XM-1]CUW39814.1 putative Acyl-CoA synthetase (AMP-forming)/AMP-acid ligase II [Magnetospirillum sp. XM-1]